jgi:anti-sigma-K factor RskA
MTNPSDEEMDLLVAYSLDELEPHEAERVSRLLAERPELRATAAELRATLEKLPYALPDAEVPDTLRERTLNHATGGSRRESAAPRQPPLWRRLTLVFGALSGALAVVAALLLGQLGDTQRQLAQARFELEQVAAERDQIVRVVSSSEVIAQLDGDAGRATLLQTPEGERLLAAQLPALAEGRVYQLWSIAGQAAPVSAGTFEVQPDGSALVRVPAGTLLTPETVFAVTDEPGPQGSPAPTTTPLIVGGPVGV